MGILERPAKAQAGPAVRRSVQHAAPIEEQVPGDRLHEPREGVQPGGFTGAVRAAKDKHLLRWDLEVDAIQGCDPAKDNADPLRPDDCLIR